MSARRWFVLLGFVVVSLLLSLGWFAWAAWNAPPGRGMEAMGLTGILNLIELPLAYFLLRLSDSAHAWTLRLTLMKLVSAVAFGVGLVAGAGAAAGAVALALGVFYAAYALFLRWNAEFFG